MTNPAPEPVTSRDARKNFKAALQGPQITIIARAWWTRGPCQVRALIVPLNLNPYEYKQNTRALAAARKQFAATLKLLREATQR